MSFKFDTCNPCATVRTIHRFAQDAERRYYGVIDKGDQVQIGHFPGELEPRVKERYTYNGQDRMGPGGAKSGEWLGSIKFLYCCDFLLLPIASYCSQCLLLVVRRSKHTPRHKLPPSPATSCRLLLSLNVSNPSKFYVIYSLHP